MTIKFPLAVRFFSRKGEPEIIPVKDGKIDSIVMLKGAVSVNTLSTTEACGHTVYHRQASIFESLAEALKKFPMLGDPMQFVFFPEFNTFESWERIHHEICDEYHTKHDMCLGCPIAELNYSCNANRLP